VSPGAGPRTTTTLDATPPPAYARDMPARDPAAFRAAYRAQIHPRYAPRLHAAFVFGGGLAVIAWQLTVVRASALAGALAFLAGLGLLDVGVYAVHRGLGHRRRRLARMFYQRHAVEHHGFFQEASMTYDELRDLRVILFPPWLLVVVALAALGAGALVGGGVGPALSAGLVGGYLLYEFCHLCHHLPDDHPLPRLPWLRQMRQLHRLHHRPSNMASYNFDIILPVTDLLCGTLRWEPIGTRPDDVAG
jgi:sterol desaturase/sphingolipid hydroxylase (fatty acid hydroxylase superfamily)